MTNSEENGRRLAPEQVDVLLAEYAQLSETDRAVGTVFTALASVAVALVAGILALLTQGCPDGTVDPNCQFFVSRWVYMLVPLPALVVVAYGVQIGSLSTLRSFYLRAIERRLHEGVRLESALHAQDSVESGDLHGQPVRLHLRHPSFTHLSMALVSGPHGLPAFRGLYPVINTALGILLLTVAGLAIVRIEPRPLTVVVGLVYAGSLAYVGRAAYRGLVRGHGIWMEAVEQLPQHWDRSIGRRKDDGQRALVSYLLLPRTSEIVKAIFIPMGYILGLAFLGGRVPLSEALGVWLIVEFVAYHGRYQFNDLRDRLIDQQSPAVQHSRRMPASDGAPGATLAAIVVRIVIVAWVVLSWPTPAASGVLSTSVAIVAAGVVYELLRDRTRFAFQKGEPAFGTRLLIYVLYIAVGLGYGIRVAAGLWLGSGMTATPALLGLTVITSWALGTMWVMMTWALEGTAYLPDGKRQPEPTIRLKSHLFPLLKEALTGWPLEGEDAPDTTSQRGGKDRQGSPEPRGGEGTGERRVWRTTPLLKPARGPTTTWNIAFVCAATAAPILGAALAVGGQSPGLRLGATLAALGLAAGVLVTWVSPASALIIVVVGASAMVITGMGAGDTAGLAAIGYGLPFLLAAVGHWMFRMSTYANLDVTVSEVLLGLVRGVNALAERLARKPSTVGPPS